MPPSPSTISYDSPQPDQAQQVASELATLYLNENAKARQQSVAETTAFLSQEANRLGTQIQDIETKLAQFKRRYAGRLPDSSVVNMQLADRAGSELMRVEREMSTVKERQLSLEAQLRAVSPNAPPVANAAGARSLTPAERLRALQAQYASASAVYGADHPDIRRMQREIAALGAETGTPGKASRYGSFEEARSRTRVVAGALRRRSPRHPADQSRHRSVKGIRGQGARPQKGSAGSIGRPDNPAYVALVAQIEGAKREFNQLAASREISAASSACTTRGCRRFRRSNANTTT